MQQGSQPIVLITFYCQNGETEQLALAAAVGAVQSRGLIRLRRLPDIGMVSDTESLLRMRKEYVPPTENDIRNADALIVIAPPDFSDSSIQWKPYLELLSRLANTPALRNKVVGSIGVKPMFFRNLGISTVTNSSNDAMALGRAVTEAVRSRKQPQEFS